LEDRTLPATHFVAPSGTDLLTVSTPDNPFQSIMRAVNVAHNGDVIKVAAGTYTYNPAQDAGFSTLLGFRAAVQVLGKQLTILGGYSTADWNNANPTVNLTTIDGRGVTRGVDVASPGTATSLDMEGFTIRGGVAHGIPTRRGLDDSFFGIGGGMLVEGSHLTLRNMVFDSNQALGDDSTGPYGGGGAGGGLAIRYTTDIAVLDHITFSNNLARGGTGTLRGGFGQGGGLFTNFANVTGNYITFTNNQAIGGSSNGVGFTSDGSTADGIGGGTHVVQSSTVRLSHVTATGNLALGGNAPNGTAGAGDGGALDAEQNTLTVTDSVIRDNTAQGGVGANLAIASGYGLGGGIAGTNSNVTVERTLVIQNKAIGGTITNMRALAGGGGISVSSFLFPTNLLVENSVVADNQLQFGAGPGPDNGGGAAIWVEGSSADILHTTIAGNRFVNPSAGNTQLAGTALFVPLGVNGVVASVNFSWNIVADQPAPSAGVRSVAVLAQTNQTVHYNQNLFANDDLIDNSAGGQATFTGSATNLTAQSAGFVSPSAPNFNYHLVASSPAIDQATNGTEPIDFDRQPRAVGTPRDLGAFEFAPPGSPGIRPRTPGVYDPATATWYLRNSSSAGTPDIAPFPYGLPGWLPLIGDWNNDGVDSVGVVDPASNTFYLRNFNSPGAPDVTPFAFGAPGWIPVAGNWLGYGPTTIGVFDPSTATWYLRSSNSSGAPDVATFVYGAPGWIPVVGDWNGDGVTSIGVIDPATGTWYLRNENNPGAPDAGTFVYGVPGWKPVVGDWSGHGSTGIGIVDPATGTWYLRNETSSGAPDAGVFPYGLGAWTPLAGAYNSSGAAFGFPARATGSREDGVSIVPTTPGQASDQNDEAALVTTIVDASSRARSVGRSATRLTADEPGNPFEGPDGVRGG
jgi:hypothetical protein